MTFKELKSIIENTQNKEMNYTQISINDTDSFYIKSALYVQTIEVGNISSPEDIFNNTLKLDYKKELFENPYYIIVSIEDFNEKTMEIINQLGEGVYVEVDISTYVGAKEFQTLSKLTHKRLQLNCRESINLDIMLSLAEKYQFSEDTIPTIVINKIDEKTEEKIAKASEIIKNVKFGFVINDGESLQNLDRIIPYIPNDEIRVKLSDNLFIENNPQNARDLIFQNDILKDHDNKKIIADFRNIIYDNIDQVFKLEKDIELIKSHIPSGASELDIVTFSTLFMINYFKYKDKNKNINLAELISSGEGVCRDFARFTEYFLNSCGIECEIVAASGHYQGDEEIEGHDFNVVKIGNNNYFLDNTWLIDNVQYGAVHSLSESSDFLRSNEDFNHNEYKVELSEYNCKTYNRQEINDSVNRVIEWRDNYEIHPQSLRDLFRKYLNKKSVEEKIKDAIPGRK